MLGVTYQPMAMDAWCVIDADGNEDTVYFLPTMDEGDVYNALIDDYPTPITVRRSTYEDQSHADRSS